MEPQFEPLDSENHVFCVLEPEATLHARSDKTYTTHDFLEIISNFLKNYVFASGFDFWTKTGVQCNLLKVGSNGWVKGKVRVKIILEFAPDEPDDNVS
ncbi:MULTISPECIES: KGK domain-containing protein [unclassified Microcoleus]|uniref:KGK domain-containing protein n=1 Tax=unclassified Microcoleus TaxID=2642155 RepID=UPI002FD1CB71